VMSAARAGVRSAQLTRNSASSRADQRISRTAAGPRVPWRATLQGC
jgi:hypothetical protein